jgi:hypothetical protein
MRRGILPLVLAAFLAGPAGAIDLKPSLSPSFEGFGTVGTGDATSTLANPGNQVLATPDWTLGVDLRPSLDVSFGESVRAVFRPRYLGSVSGVIENGASQRLTSSQLLVDEAYGRWEISSRWNVSAGILNVQWGPAEFLGPSNPIYHFHTDERSLLYRPRGQVLLRVIYSYSADLTAVALIEPLANGESPWIAQVPYTPRALLKLEKRFSNPADYVGLTGGREDQGQAFLGQYANAYLTDALSVYADGRQTIGSPGYTPLLGGPVPVLTQSQLDDGRLYALVTVGVRYEGDLDSRIEYIYNAYGLNRSQFGTELASLLLSPDNLIRASEPGRELNQQHYLYFSLRADHWGKGDTLRVGLRYLLCLQDGSGSAVASAELALNDHLTALAQGEVSHGTATSEFGQAPPWTLFAGARLAY